MAIARINFDRHPNGYTVDNREVREAAKRGELDPERVDDLIDEGELDLPEEFDLGDGLRDEMQQDPNMTGFGAFSRHSARAPDPEQYEVRQAERPIRRENPSDKYIDASIEGADELIHGGERYETVYARHNPPSPRAELADCSNQVISAVEQTARAICAESDVSYDMILDTPELLRVVAGGVAEELNLPLRAVVSALRREE